MGPSVANSDSPCMPKIPGVCPVCKKEVNSLRAHFYSVHRLICKVRYANDRDTQLKVVRDSQDNLFHCLGYGCEFKHRSPSSFQKHAERCREFPAPLRLRLVPAHSAAEDGETPDQLPDAIDLGGYGSDNAEICEADRMPSDAEREEYEKKQGEIKLKVDRSGDNVLGDDEVGQGCQPAVSDGDAMEVDYEHEEAHMPQQDLLPIAEGGDRLGYTTVLSAHFSRLPASSSGDSGFSPDVHHQLPPTARCDDGTVPLSPENPPSPENNARENNHQQSWADTHMDVDDNSNEDQSQMNTDESHRPSWGAETSQQEHVNPSAHMAEHMNVDIHSQLSAASSHIGTPRSVSHTSSSDGIPFGHARTRTDREHSLVHDESIIVHTHQSMPLLSDPRSHRPFYPVSYTSVSPSALNMTSTSARTNQQPMRLTSAPPFVRTIPLASCSTRGRNSLAVSAPSQTPSGAVPPSRQGSAFAGSHHPISLAEYPPAEGALYAPGPSGSGSRARRSPFVITISSDGSVKLEDEDDAPLSAARTFVAGISRVAHYDFLADVLESLGFDSDPLIDILCRMNGEWHIVYTKVLARGTLGDWLVLKDGLETRAANLASHPDLDVDEEDLKHGAAESFVRSLSTSDRHTYLIGLLSDNGFDVSQSLDALCRMEDVWPAMKVKIYTEQRPSSFADWVLFAWGLRLRAERLQRAAVRRS